VAVGHRGVAGEQQHPDRLPQDRAAADHDGTVTYCHSRTADLPSATREADVLIVAVGRPRFLRGDHIRPGAVVIDAGYHPGNVGDVDFDSAHRRAGLLTPVPGGVGPMTIATLLTQTVEAAARQLGVLGAEVFTGTG
jgi:methylenetetrahydrofolate dehydrogenase (NADP+)/methenyltetrahydrofolate cyclohydrolase